MRDERPDDTGHGEIASDTMCDSSSSDHPDASAAQTPATSPLRPRLPVRSDQPAGTVLTLLGTSGGPQADYGRTGTSSALTVGGRNYVVDAGRSSVTQYLNAGLRFSALNGMFITHLHADHVADYYNYFLLEGGQPNTELDHLSGPLTVYGPGRAGASPPAPDPSLPTIAPQNPTPGVVDLTERLNEGYAYHHNLFMRGTGTRDIRTLQDVHDIELPDTGAGPLGPTAPAMVPFVIHEDDRVSVSAILVPHGAVFPAFAFRFDTDEGSVVFSGDTCLSDNVVRLAEGADVLVHEVLDLDFFQGAGLTGPLLHHLEESHTTTGQVGRIAERAGVALLVLTHLVPSNPALIPDEAWHRTCSRGFGGCVHVGNDLDRISMPGAR